MNSIMQHVWENILLAESNKKFIMTIGEDRFWRMKNRKRENSDNRLHSTPHEFDIVVALDGEQSAYKKLLKLFF